MRLRDDEHPWIVCPRRLLSLRKGNGPDYQEHVKKQLVHYSGLPKGQRHRAWSEVKMKVATVTEDEQSKSFDYSFDYILAGSQRMPVKQVGALLKLSERKIQSLAEENGFTLARRNNELWVDDFPAPPIVIVEIMTSSTSGGDKKKRTQIGMAFEDAVINGINHQGPGINYRQVWARMVSQLIVVSGRSKGTGSGRKWSLLDELEFPTLRRQ